MVAVLPFENLGAAEDEYFADGLTEEITSRLAAVSGLGVISRTSAMQYKEDRPPLKQVGQELGVDYVLEGTVRWERSSEGPSRIRVTPQLIRVADDTHLWSERYDRELEQLFEVQSSIAGEVTSALNVTLLEPEQAAIDEQPTENMEAHQAYLRGLELWFRPGFDWDVFERAGDMFERAVELDPDFLLAYTELVGVYGMLYSWRDRTEDRLADLERVMSRAEALDPAHPQVRLAKGFYYYFGFWEYEKALEEFLAAEAMLPNLAEVPEAKAYVLRRLGRMEEAAEALSRAFKLDPRNAHFSSELGRTLTAMRRHAEAVQYHDRAIQLAPDSRHVYYLKAFNQLAWKGDVAGARQIIDEQAPGDASEDQVFDWTLLAQLTGDYEAALDRLGVLAAAADAAGERAPWVRNNQGWFHELLGNIEASRSFYEKAADEVAETLEESPELAPARNALAFAAAGLGQKDLALRENQTAYELVEKDHFWSPSFLEDRARIYTRFDEADAALDLLEELLATPYDYSVTVALLRLEPVWIPLHDHPRFQALLEKHETDRG
jgi:TolB-like protein/Tfp pilus assembly protein PilF